MSIKIKGFLRAVTVTQALAYAAQYPGETDQVDYDPAKYPVFDSRKERNTGQSLCNTDCKRVQYRSGKS